MNITPIDMQVIIPKATEVGKGQQIRDHQEVLQQQFGATEFQKHADHKLRQVQTSEKAEGKKIKNDSSRQRKKDQSKQNHTSDRDDETGTADSVMAVDTFRGRNIDIKM